MEKVTTTRIALKWGLILGLLGILASTILYITGTFTQSILSFFISLAIFIVTIVFAFKDFKEANDSSMTFGQGVGLGLLMFVVAGVMSGLFDLFYKNIIDTELIAKQIGLIEEQYEKAGLSPDMIEQALSSASTWMNGPLAMLSVVFSYAVSGLILSLIVAAFMKKEKSPFE